MACHYSTSIDKTQSLVRTNEPTKSEPMKLITTLILCTILSACGGGEEEPADAVANEQPTQQVPKPNCAANQEVCK